jgi:hypothetical protein
MELLTAYQLRNRSEAHFQAVLDTPDVDVFCSSLDWMWPAYEAFIPDHPLYLSQSESGFVTMARGFNPRIGRYFQPLEASWCLACPFAGPDPRALIRDFADDLRSRNTEWDVLYLSGIPQSSTWLDAIVTQFGSSHRVGLGHDTNRFLASLKGGVEGFLSRRSSKFRANLRGALRRCERDQIRFEQITIGTEIDVEAFYERVIRVEEQSWKGKLGSGILDSGMNTFYRIMLPRLVKRSALRATFAMQGDKTIGFVFGGVLGASYRGLQLSFDDAYQSYSLGNVLQFQMIQALCDEQILFYDLGSELEYKTRWAEMRQSSVTLWIWR